jgi:transcriptional regulator GlxA family with amidase domain
MKRIGVIVFPGFQILDLAAIAAFELANNQLGEKFYRVDILSEQGGSVDSSCGVRVDSKRFTPAKFDTVIMTGAVDIPPPSDALCRFLRSAHRVSRRMASICTGAFALAEAGLLEGRQATTHWHYASELQSRFSQTKVQPDRIFINDGRIWTSAGMTAGIDLALALVEDDLGIETARFIARKLVVYHRRTGGQSQFSALLDLAPKTDRMQKTLSYARANLREPLSVEDLAAVANLSPRQFRRSFKSETGQSPARAIEKMRIEAAQALIETGKHSLDMIARETGFLGRERMRRAFMRTFGQPPQILRRVAKQQAGR